MITTSNKRITKDQSLVFSQRRFTQLLDECASLISGEKFANINYTKMYLFSKHEQENITAYNSTAFVKHLHIITHKLHMIVYICTNRKILQHTTVQYL